MELNAEQIKKALENWVKYYDGNALDLTILRNALALITSQERRIKELTEENERLNTAIPIWINQCVDLEERCMQLRADTVREMQERLTTEIERFAKRGGFLSKETIFWFIDQAAKEMLEDKK